MSENRIHFLALIGQQVGEPERNTKYDPAHCITVRRLAQEGEFSEPWAAEHGITLPTMREWIESRDFATRCPDLTLEEAIAEEFSEALEAKRSPKGSLPHHGLQQDCEDFPRDPHRAYRGRIFNAAGHLRGGAGGRDCQAGRVQRGAHTDNGSGASREDRHAVLDQPDGQVPVRSSPRPRRLAGLPHVAGPACFGRAGSAALHQGEQGQRDPRQA